ncbi:hypothetical protein CIT25_21360 [Mesorhizobium mediterraneum]|uniref:Uncharacterized protein n=1 Tax=Mesorhizobium mediterraneum TaxID=43617 RepID=A0AB36R6D6_9HYPH|nr:hypothetical protein CIT25_21360 [Mesorhizobium mediterraneum]
MGASGSSGSFAYEIVEKDGRDVLRCCVADEPSELWLELPIPMFDRAVCAADALGRGPPLRR